MAYEKQEWVAEETIISAARMSHIEDGIEAGGPWSARRSRR